MSGISYPIFVPERCVPFFFVPGWGMDHVGHTSILDVVQVSGAVSKEWVSTGAGPRAPGETQVSANSCCDYPSPGCDPGSGHIAQG